MPKAAGCWIRVSSGQPGGRSGGQRWEGACLVHFSSPVSESCRQRCQAGLQNVMNVKRNDDVKHSIKTRSSCTAARHLPVFSYRRRWGTLKAILPTPLIRSNDRFTCGEERKQLTNDRSHTMRRTCVDESVLKGHSQQIT